MRLNICFQFLACVLGYISPSAVWLFCWFLSRRFSCLGVLQSPLYVAQGKSWHPPSLCFTFGKTNSRLEKQLLFPKRDHSQFVWDHPFISSRHYNGLRKSKIQVIMAYRTWEGVEREKLKRIFSFISPMTSHIDISCNLMHANAFFLSIEHIYSEKNLGIIGSHWI